jgi:chaperone BCS1
MIDYIVQIIKENSIAQGGLVIAAFSAMLYYFKQVPRLAMNVFYRRCTSYISLDHDQEPLKWMLNWLSETEYGKNTRHLTVANDEGDIAIGSGKHFFFRDGALVVVSYTRQHVEHEGINMGLKENVDLRVIPGKRKVIVDLLKEAKEKYSIRYENKLSICMPHSWGENWIVSDEIEKQKLDSVILTEENNTLLKQRLQRFIDNKEVCLKYGIPWRMGLLLHGPPGNGKSSLAKAIASYMDYKLCILNLNGIKSDKELIRLAADLPKESVLLIEDIDAYNIDRDNEKKNDISLSGLLNALDGVTAKDGRITVITTNCPEQLDEALIRKGRVDINMKLDHPTQYQIEKMFDRFGKTYNGENFDNMASVQDYLLNFELTSQPKDAIILT